MNRVASAVAVRSSQSTVDIIVLVDALRGPRYCLATMPPAGFM